ncbi:hypothetical protein GVAV_003182, partial [Gurleya vavrai]
KIDHINVIKLEDCYENYDLKTVILVFDFVPYTLKNYNYRSYIEKINILAQIANGLTKIHSDKIVHMDLKPQNILVTDDGIVKIADFGSSIIIDDNLKFFYRNEGSVEYRSIEMIGQYAVGCPSFDMWSFVCIIYEVWTNEILFSGFTENLVKSFIDFAFKQGIRNYLTTKKRFFPVPLLEIIEGCLVKDPLKRFTAEKCLGLLLELQNMLTNGKICE